MISNISFAGKVKLLGDTQRFRKDKEIERLRECAQNNDCDILVLNRDKYDEGIVYETIVLKENKETGKIDWFSNVFGFNKIQKPTILK